MATTVTYSGSLQFLLDVLATFSGDSTGGRRTRTAIAKQFAAAGGAAPTLSGFLAGAVSVAAATDVLLAAATAPTGTTYSDGFTGNGAKVKGLYVRNSHASATLQVARGAANGAPVFDAGGDSITLGPGGFVFLYFETGTAALTSGSNDKLTLTNSGGTVSAEIVVLYGP